MQRKEFGGEKSANPPVNQWKTVLDTCAAVLLALVPILQHYIGIVDNAGTTVLVLLAPYFFLRMLPALRSFKLSDLRFAWLLMAYFVYKLIDHGTYLSEVAQVGIMCFYLLCLCLNVIDTKALKNAAVIIAVLAGVAILAQYVTYYLMGQYHLRMVPVSWLLPESEAWVERALTGKVGVTGAVSRFYRPSAFFLEPSHLFLYSFPGLFITLFSGERKKESLICAILISIGMVLSTSGMGIAAALGGWALYFLLHNPADGSFQLRNIIRKQNLILIGCFVLAAGLAVAFVPILRESVLRIFTNPEGSTAIAGRIQKAFERLSTMSWKQWIIGISDYSGKLHFNKPGFMLTAYRYGIIGIILSYSVYVRSLFKVRVSYFWYAVILLVVSFFSVHTHGTFFMLFYVALLKEGENVTQEPWIRGLTGIFRRSQK